MQSMVRDAAQAKAEAARRCGPTPLPFDLAPDGQPSTILRQNASHLPDPDFPCQPAVMVPITGTGPGTGRAKAQVRVCLPCALQPAEVPEWDAAAADVLAAKDEQEKAAAAAALYARASVLVVHDVVHSLVLRRTKESGPTPTGHNVSRVVIVPVGA